MHACFAPAIDFDGCKYGIGLLSKKAPIHLQTMALPGREEARTLILAEFEDYIYCCTHLSLTEEDRMKSLDFLKAFAISYMLFFFWVVVLLFLMAFSLSYMKSLFWA